MPSVVVELEVDNPTTFKELGAKIEASPVNFWIVILLPDEEFQPMVWRYNENMKSSLFFLSALIQRSCLFSLPQFAEITRPVHFIWVTDFYVSLNEADLRKLTGVVVIKAQGARQSIYMHSAKVFFTPRPCHLYSRLKASNQSGGAGRNTPTIGRLPGRVGSTARFLRRLVRIPGRQVSCPPDVTTFMYDAVFAMAVATCRG